MLLCFYFVYFYFVKILLTIIVQPAVSSDFLNRYQLCGRLLCRALRYECTKKLANTHSVIAPISIIEWSMDAQACIGVTHNKRCCFSYFPCWLLPLKTLEAKKHFPLPGAGVLVRVSSTDNSIIYWRN